MADWIGLTVLFLTSDAPSMLSGISIVCFAASYAVALGLEVSRMFFRASARTAAMVGFMFAGIIAHSLFLGREAQQGLSGGAPLSSWFHGCLILAWLLAISFAFVSLQKQRSSLGLILLPTILGLVAIAQVFPRTPQLSTESSYRIWGIGHGLALLLGAAVVIAGFVAGLLYVWQSYRLKQRKPPAIGAVRLPSLEALQKINESSLIVSCGLLVIGLVSGILLNIIRGDRGIVWTDPVIWPSGVLLIWLVAALIFNALYKPARQGRKVAYLTVASAIFLGLVLGILFSTGSHGPPEENGLPKETPDVARLAYAANRSSR